MIRDLQDVRRKLDDAWQSFVVNKRVPRSIKPEILRSWQRACSEWRIDPGLRQCLSTLSADELRMRAESEEALRVAAPLLTEFGERLAPDGHALIYCGADGVALAMVGNARTCNRLADMNLAPGASWSEASTGTNGIGTALVEGRGVEVFASEHFVEAWQAWNCAGVPVRAAGRIVGLLDISSPWQVREPNLLVCAEALARAIEGRLDALVIRREEILRRALFEKGNTGWLALDPNGRTVGTGPAAGFFSHDPMLQRTLEPILVRLRTTKGEFEHVVDVGRVPVRIVCSPIRDGTMTIGGVLRVATTTSSRAPSNAAPTRRRMYQFDDILGSSASLKQQVTLARSAASSRLPILILGESGTGKELFAQAIHCASGRAREPFVAVNCGAIPPNLLEAELFGYEPGSFTGARNQGQHGRFENADGGTLFLDEISDLSLAGQTALLRVLEQHEVIRIGSSTPRRVDVRVIAASNKDLRDQMETGAFRQDLYYRLEGVTLELPPLRHRKEDIPALTDRHLMIGHAETGRAAPRISSEAMLALVAYDWPGNVRELKNVVERAIVVATGPEISVSDLPREVQFAPARHAIREVSGSNGADPKATAILRAIEECSWNLVHAARALGISRRTLYRKIHKYGLARRASAPTAPPEPPSLPGR